MSVDRVHRRLDPLEEGSECQDLNSPGQDVESPSNTRLPDWLTETPYWAVSAVFHVLLLLVIGGVVLLRSEPEPEARTTVRIDHTPPPPPEPRKRAPVDNPVTLEPTKDDTISRIPTKVPSARKLKDREIMTDPFKNPSLNVFQGIGGGGGAISSRNRGPDQAGGRGATEATESAVMAALYWLKRHQHPDGRWSGADFTHNCDREFGVCSMRKEWATDGRGTDEHDVGLTALAVLAFVGHGFTHQFGDFQDVVGRAKKWLLAQQSWEAGDHHGRLGSGESEQWIYSHAIATLALSELLFFSKDRFTKLPRAVKAATQLCFHARNENYAWKYGIRDGKNDTSVTGWMVLALKASKYCARARLINIDQDQYQPHFDGALNWFDRATAKTSGRVGYEAPGDDGAQLRGVYPEPYPFTKQLSCMTAVSVLCRLFAGQSKRSEPIKRGVHILERERPHWRMPRKKRLSKINMYYWYYATYAMFQHGGRPWKKWNQAMQEALIPYQRVGSCEDGSWDPVGEWGAVGGRVYATAINAMTLEVYYRYRRSTAEQPK